MKKVLFIHKYGRDFKYSVFLVDDKIAERISRLARAKMFDMAYEVASWNDLTTEAQRQRKDWDSLRTVNILLAYFGKHHARKEFR
jgi:hypothetical protein